jgi:hypothetical protein
MPVLGHSQQMSSRAAPALITAGIESEPSTDAHLLIRDVESAP